MKILRQACFRLHAHAPRRGVPMVTVVLLGGAIVAFLGGDAVMRPLLFQTDDLASGRWWTLWTAHWVHFSFSHLLWDVLGVAGLGAWLESRIGSRRLAGLLFLAAPVVTLGTVGLEGDLLGYGGFSGLACVLAGALVVHGWHAGGQARRMARLVGGVLGAKIGWELLHPGNAMFVQTTAVAMRPVPWAHAVGATMGGAIEGAWRALASRRSCVRATALFAWTAD